MTAFLRSLPVPTAKVVCAALSTMLSAARRVEVAARPPDGFVAHPLRHVFASSCLAAGATVTDLARFFGHRDIQLTYARSSHFIPDAFGWARAAVGAEFQDWSSQ